MSIVLPVAVDDNNGQHFKTTSLLEGINMKHWFHILTDIGKLDEKKLQGYFLDKEMVDVIRTAFSELTTGKHFPDDISPPDFSTLIYELHETIKIWGRKLGDTIISSGELAEKGDFEAAVRILEELKVKCPAPYFRQQADNQIAFYKEKMK